MGGLPLIYVQERSGGPQLVRRNHKITASGEIRIGYAYTTPITASSINFDAQHIKCKFEVMETCGSYRILGLHRIFRTIRSHYIPLPEMVGVQCMT